MATNIPEEQILFSQLAVKQGWIVPEQARSALELYRRYQAKGGEQPSIARILINKGYIGRKQGEQLLRHIHKGESLPPPNPITTFSKAISPHPDAAPSVRPPSVPAFAEPAPPVPKDVPPPPPKYVPKDTESAILKGMGALVLSKDLMDIKGYKIESVVGEGSMGIVYKAVQLSMERDVALKVLPPERTKDAKFVEEFLTEARNAGRLNHPNLIRVHEVGKNGSLFFYSMEYIDGHRLDEMMDERDHGRLDPKETVSIFSQVASALDYGFRAGIIHREVRPNTVMVTEDGLAKLADLGLVKDEQTRFLTGENAFFVAPEQVTGKPVDTRTDIYSLGCCMFQALTGERPFEKGTPKEVMLRRVHSPPPNVLTFNPKLPQELARIVSRMMQREPSLRFQTPGEVVDALKKVPLAPGPALKTPAKTSLRAARRRFRR
ncbi:MAG TPA: serine/threonine-protein kinase [Planctomycetota bacterium]|nr:serine/threonine-protein kinase [Planctomycetota bacterium]